MCVIIIVRRYLRHSLTACVMIYSPGPSTSRDCKALDVLVVCLIFRHPASPFAVPPPRALVVHEHIIRQVIGDTALHHLLHLRTEHDLLVRAHRIRNRLPERWVNLIEAVDCREGLHKVRRVPVLADLERELAQGQRLKPRQLVVVCGPADLGVDGQIGLLPRSSWTICTSQSLTYQVPRPLVRTGT